MDRGERFGRLFLQSARRRVSRWGFLLLSVAALCGAGIAPGLAAEAPKAGGTVVIGLGDSPTFLAPDFNANVPDVMVGCMLYDALVRFGQGFEIVPGLAKSWDISPDGLVYTLHLEAANWQDGKPVTSADVKFTLTELSAKYGPKFNAPGKAIDSIDDSDPKTVVIKLKKTFGPFLFSLACEQNAAILPAHLLRGGEILKNPALLAQPVGNGPFKLAEWVRGDHITVSRNPDYWRKGEPYLDRIVLKFLPDPSARVLALQAGEIDFIDEYYFPLSSYKIIASDPRFQVKEVGYPSDDLIIFNTKRAPFDNPKVRQALLMAIDREYIHKFVHFGVGSVGESAIDTRLKWAHNPAVAYDKLYAFDPARAKATLDEAGFKPGADGTRFTINLVFSTARAEDVAESQVLQRFWQDVGAKVVLNGLDGATFQKQTFADYDFDVAQFNYTTGGDPALGVARLYTTETINPKAVYVNVSRYSRPEIDDLFAAGRDAPTQAERAKAYFKAQEILSQDLPVILVHQQALTDAASVRLQDVYKAAHYLWWGSVWLKD